MFDNSSIMVLLNAGNEIQLLEVDKPTQMAICSSFAEAAVPLLSGKQIITFNGSYKPSEDEVLSICNFHLPEIIRMLSGIHLDYKLFHMIKMQKRTLGSICR